MTAQTLSPPEQIVHLSGISWQTYETLLAEIGDRQIRLRYNRGNLEIMVPSPEHERFKTIMGRFVETLAEELEVRIEPLGSTTFKRPELSGAEPDECFYIQNISAVKGKKRIDLNQEPPPDLVVKLILPAVRKIACRFMRFWEYRKFGFIMDRDSESTDLKMENTLSASSV